MAKKRVCQECKERTPTGGDMLCNECRVEKKRAEEGDTTKDVKEQVAIAIHALEIGIPIHTQKAIAQDLRNAIGLARLPEDRKGLTGKILNGQVWKQHELPMCTRTVLMWDCIDSIMHFVLLSTADYSASNGYSPPMICSEEDGTMLFTEAELLTKFETLNYSLVEDGQYHLLNADGVKKINPYTDWV